MSERVFRLSGSPGLWPWVDDLLRCQGYVFTELPFYPGARRLEQEPLPLGSSLAARFGCIYIQDASSMLPALALARAFLPAGPCAALDMCASPGGKTSLLADLLGPESLVLANDPSPKRLATLRRNLDLLNIFNAASLGFPGETLPLAGENFDCILLDPPCSAWGTAEKHPKALTLWQGDKLKPLIALQRQLLRAALALLRPGGILLYSTCTFNVQENEEQIRWAVEELSSQNTGFAGLPLDPFPGFAFDEVHPCAPGSLRVAGGKGLGQGFYLAALRKLPAAHPLESGGPPVLCHRNYAHFEELRPSPLLDPSLLPPGWIQTLPGGVYFQHAQGQRIAPSPSVPWRGFFLGRAGSGPRGLMPPPDKAHRNQASILQTEDAAPLLALLSGRSLPGFAGQREAGLYYKELPLARLKVKGNRMLL